MTGHRLGRSDGNHEDCIATRPLRNKNILLPQPESTFRSPIQNAKIHFHRHGTACFEDAGPTTIVRESVFSFFLADLDSVGRRCAIRLHKLGDGMQIHSGSMPKKAPLIWSCTHVKFECQRATQAIRAPSRTQAITLSLTSLGDLSVAQNHQGSLVLNPP